MWKKINIILFLFCFFIQNKVFTQAPDYNFQRISVNEGLSQGSVRDILEDDLGYLWFATADGLNRYDGYEFHSYHHHGEDSTSIVSGDVQNLYKDSKRNIWITTEGGLSIYDRFKDNFITLDVKSNGNITPIFENNQNQLFSCDKNGNIFIFDVKKRSKIAKFALPDSLIANPFFLQKDDLILVFAPTKLYAFNTNQKEWQIFPIPTKLVSPTSGIFFKDNYWIGDAQGKLSRYSSGFELIEQIKISDSPINAITTYANSDLLLGTTNGMFFYSLFNKSKNVYRYDVNKGTSLSANDIRCFLYDNSGNLWIGTNTSGLNKSIYSNKKLNLLRSPDYYQIKCIVKDTRSNELYCGVHGKGIDIYDLLGSETAPTTIPSPHKYSYTNTVDNNTLAFFYPKGIDFLNKETQKITSINDNVFNKNTPNIKAVFKGENSLFYFVSEQSLFEFNPRSFALHELFVFQEKINVTALERHDDVFWIGSDNGLFLLKNNVLANVIDKIFVKSILVEVDNSLWIATTTGLYNYHLATQNAKLYDDKYGLANNFVYGILKDNAGNLWCSHNRGLSRFNPQMKYFRNYGLNDGIQAFEYNTGAFHKASDDMIIFGGVGGINYFYSNIIAENPVTPRPLITKIRINDDDFKTDTSIWYKRYLELPFSQNTVSFDFVGLQYTNTERNEYAYLLEGVDKEWINAGNRRFARYANLEPGIYTFKVKSANSDNHWNTTEAKLTIKITAPFWMSWWFRTLAVLLFLGMAGAAIFFYQQRKIRKQRRQIEIQKQVISERERISRDLHDNIGAQITYIISSMDWAKNQIPKENEPLQERFDHLRSNTQSLMSSLRDTIWTLNKNSIKPIDFFDRLRQYVNYNVQRHSILEVAFFENVDCDNELPPNVVLNLFRICQEAIQNVVKHAQANVLTISIVCLQGNGLRIAISDDGKGFDRENKRDDSFGLDNMRYRAEEIGASIQILSAEKKGTSVEIELKMT
jgi:signal transduction histidine kinase/ligand-binding sensor domain-containing protein